MSTRRGLVRVGTTLWGLAAALMLLAVPTIVWAEEGSEAKTKVDLYGLAMLDMGYQSGQTDPDCYDDGLSMGQ